MKHYGRILNSFILMTGVFLLLEIETDDESDDLKYNLKAKSSLPLICSIDENYFL